MAEYSAIVNPTDETATVTEAPEGAEVVTETPDEGSSFPLVIDEKTFTFVEFVIKGGRKVAGGKTTQDVVIAKPSFESNEEVGEYVTALLNEAEKNKEGSAEILQEKILGRHTKDANASMWTPNPVTKELELELEKVLPSLIATRKTGRITLEELEQLNADLLVEMLPMFPILAKEGKDPEGFLADIEALGLTVDDFAVKAVSIQNRMQDVVNKMAKIKAESEARKATRSKKEKEAAAKAPAAAVPPPVSTAPAETVVA